MATYTGSDKRLGYLFQNGGGGGSSTLAGLSDVSLSSPTDGQVLKYDANNQEWVNANESGGGGVVNDGTVGARIEVTLPHSSSVTFTFAELGITKYGSYWIFVNSKHAESGSSGWKWIGFAQYSGYYTSSYQTSYVTQMYASKVTVTMNEQAGTITFANTNGTWDVDHLIEVLPLHPKIDVAKHAYSATEQVVGTWIDGKPIYEKTVHFTTGTANTYNQESHGIVDIDKIWIDFSNSFVDKSSGSSVMYNGIMPYSTSPASFQMMAGVGDSDIFYRVAADMENKDCYITLRYTKSTD